MINEDAAFNVGTCDATQRADLLRSRAKTAMHRDVCSRPIAIALSEGLIHRECSVFDYGCGRGADIRFLRKQKVVVDGWDPHYRPNVDRIPADVVNLAYVLNVIEDPSERSETLRTAYELARQLLVVSVRVDRALEPVADLADGHLTRTGTFQKIYDQTEFVTYVTEVLGVKPQVAALGIVYIFKDPAIQARFVANRAFTRRLEYRSDLIAEFKADRIARRYVRRAHELGRVPLPEEFSSYDVLCERFGSPQRIERLLLSQINRESFEGTREQRKHDILTFLASLRLQLVPLPAAADLQRTVRADIRGLWGSYQRALKESERLLFSLGNADVVSKACREAGVGKLLPEDLYFHTSAESDLPAVLRLLLCAARSVTGDVAYDVVKVRLDGRAISFLKYNDFDGDPHPTLFYSVRVYLPRASYQIRHFGKSDNPPILHRKDALVLPTYPYFGRFRELTEAEVSAGLLDRPDIGMRRQWTELLALRGFRLEGHALRAITSVESTAVRTPGRLGGRA
ncbi:MAG TPA: DNA phosphorothioation-associated putative methyltransferase [Candidatus Limnocylindrales bacterium]|nr:DNA phosphorothioation-associated putative methyltransferase [Candidatus Limnocylindrales bacterium]